jgi:hypothetical protein
MDSLVEQCRNYPVVDKDPSGAIGMSLAQRVYQKTGGFDVSGLSEKNNQCKIWKEIVFRKFPPLLSGETILVSEFKQRFKELKEAGYDIKPYSRLTKREARDYFRKIRRDFSF